MYFHFKLCSKERKENLNITNTTSYTMINLHILSGKVLHLHHTNAQIQGSPASPLKYLFERENVTVNLQIKDNNGVVVRISIV